MEDQNSAPPSAGATDNVRPADMLPDGDYAIVEVIGHRTIVGRISEVERFGTKLLGVEPVFAGALLPVVLIGGGSIYQLTSCTREVAAKKGPTRLYQLPGSISSTLPPEADGLPRLGWVDPVKGDIIADLDELDEDGMPF